ncbi:MAG: hypothetical protein JXR56_00390 [Candidatus Cloacimonetes bacterium]|nr:hypothetical protein [Candidatus Cloacimonadota bacterium]
MKKAVLMLCLFALLATGYAQEYSRPKAILMSALIPGTGQMYIGQKTTGSVFLSVELGILFSMFRFSSEMDWAEKNYQQYAYANTGIEKGSDSDLYQAMHNFVSSESYNESIIMNARNYYLIYQNSPQEYQDYIDQYTYYGNESWDWGNESKWMKYRDIRKTKQKYQVYQNFAVSALIINHLVSTIQTVIATRPHKGFTSSLNNLNIQPDYQKNGVNIVYSYRF